MKKPNFHKKNTEYMYQKAKKVKKVPVQKLAWAFLYISQSCLYLMGNMQNLWFCSFNIDSSSSCCSSLSSNVSCSTPFSKDPIFVRMCVGLKLMIYWGFEMINPAKTPKERGETDSRGWNWWWWNRERETTNRVRELLVFF